MLSSENQLYPKAEYYEDDTAFNVTRRLYPVKSLAIIFTFVCCLLCGLVISQSYSDFYFSIEKDLHEGAKSGNLELVRKSLASGANPKGTYTDHNWTAFHVAAYYNHPAVLKLLLESQDRNETGQDLQDDAGATPLLYAAGYGGTTAIWALAHYGENVKAYANDVLLALQKDVVVDSDTRPVKALLDTYTHIDAIMGLLDKVFKGPQEYERSKSLNHSAECGNTTAAEILIIHGACVYITDNFTGFTPLMAAIIVGRTCSAHALINATICLDSKDKSGMTALHWASYTNRPGLAQRLLQKGANATIKNKIGETPADMARKRGYYKLAKSIENFMRDDHCLPNIVSLVCQLIYKVHLK